MSEDDSQVAEMKLFAHSKVLWKVGETRGTGFVDIRRFDLPNEDQPDQYVGPRKAGLRMSLDKFVEFANKCVVVRDQLLSVLKPEEGDRILAAVKVAEEKIALAERTVAEAGSEEKKIEA